MAMKRFLLVFPVLASASNEFGVKFLKDNEKKEGVIVDASGLQYKVLQQGTGTGHPTVETTCVCHYEGRTADKFPEGKTFDSSYARGEPIKFAPHQVIKGWTIAMQMMVEGDKWELYIPSELGYGDRGHPPKIKGGDVLVFTMEIIKIEGVTVPAKKKEDAAPAAQPASSSRFVFDVANLVGEPTEASFTLEVHPEWAPLGAQRLAELVEASFFDDVRFFRVIDNFMVQFGIHGDPDVMRKWSGKNINDDKSAGIHNTRGRVSFAMAGPNTRSTQFFINFKDNSFLDKMGFTPIAEVVEGMDVVDRIFKVGEGAPGGPGPSQGQIQAKGNKYLDAEFPRLSFVKSCKARADEGAAQAPVQGKLPPPPLPLDPDGLQVSVTQAGDGHTFPQSGDQLTMHYTLTLAGDSTGNVVDSSRSRNEPFTFTIGRGEVIAGWDQGVMKMSLGERAVLRVPSTLAYGAQGTGGIPPNSDLRFDVEVLGINGKSSPGAAGLEPPHDPLGVWTIAIVLIFSLSVLFFVVWRGLGPRQGPGRPHFRFEDGLEIACDFLKY